MESSFYLDVTAIITALLAILKSLNSDSKTKNVETETKVIRLERVESKKRMMKSLLNNRFRFAT